MNWSKWVRQGHRWLAVAFTVTVVATVVALAREEPVVWVSYLPLFPLALLFFSGAYMFVLPYVVKRRAARAE
jgi:heme A synthase